MTRGGLLFDALMAGLTGGAAMVGVSVFWRSRLPANVRLSFALTCFCALCWLLAEGPFAGLVFGASPRLELLLLALGGGVIGFFWLAMRAMFEDAALTLASFAPASVMIALRLAVVFTRGLGEWRTWAWWLFTAVGFVLATHAVLVVARGWRDDLVEGRRRLRGPLLAVCAFAALQVCVYLAEGSLQRLGLGREWMGHAAYVSLLLLAILYTLLFDVRRSVFAPAPVRLGRETADEDAAALAALQRLMAEEEVWRREGLSIGELAAAMSLAPHRLRRLINGHLGHRNFAAFVNDYRVRAAMGRLADPGEARKTIAEIAFDLGFSSLNPFNRAFRQTTGEAPSAWRRRMRVGTEKGAGPSKSDETGPPAAARPDRGRPDTE